MSNAPFKIVALGDSITKSVEVVPELRWTVLLEADLAGHLLDRRIEVINAGVCGSTSREGLARIDEVLSHVPDIVLVEFGCNDAIAEAERHVDPDEFTANLGAIEKHVAGVSARLVLLPFPPIIDSQAKAPTDEVLALHGGHDAHIELYRTMSRQFASERGHWLIDIDLVLREAAAKYGWQPYFQSDGVHLTEGGNRVVADCVGAGLLKILSVA